MPHGHNALPALSLAVIYSPVSFGRNLRRCREQAGLDQTTLATLCGVKQGAVSNWERGKAFPQPTALPKIASILGVTLDDLLQGIDEDYDTMRRTTPPPAAAPSSTASPIARRALKEITRDLPTLQDHQIAVVLNWMRAFTQPSPQRDAGPSGPSGGAPPKPQRQS